MLADALGIIMSSGLKEEDGQKVLDVLGYTSVQEGMEMDKVRVSKPAACASDMAAQAALRTAEVGSVSIPLSVNRWLDQVSGVPAILFTDPPLHQTSGQVVLQIVD